MKSNSIQLLLLSLTVLFTFSSLEAQTPSYVADVDPVTPGIQTTYMTTVAAGAFTVDIYMFSPGPPAVAPPVDFDYVVLSTEFNDAGAVLGFVPGSTFSPPAIGPCPGPSCSIISGAAAPIDLGSAAPIGPGSPLLPLGFVPGALGFGGPFIGTNGGVGIVDTGGLFFGGGIGLPVAGTPIFLYTQSLLPLAVGTSDVAPIGAFGCLPVLMPFCGPGQPLAGPVGIWPDVAEIGFVGTTSTYAATPVPAAGPLFPGAINPGVVMVVTSLPVEFTAFEAQVQGQDVLLRWETATETDNTGFEVQHLAPSHDIRPINNWMSVGFVEGAGSSLEAQEYGYRVSDLNAGQHLFRLLQVDFDGAVAFSDQIEASIEVPGTHVLSAAYPNPFNPMARFTLVVAESQQVSVEVFNSIGIRVATLFDGLLAANQSHQFTLDGTALPSGTYIYRVTGSNFSDSRSVSLLK